MFRATIAAACAALLVAACPLPQAAAQPPASTFTYQGELRASGGPASGPYDFRFRIYDDPIDGNQTIAEVCLVNVSVAGGRFTANIPVPTGFNGTQRYLEIDVRPAVGSCANLAGYTTLSPRQPLTVAPYAGHALNAANTDRLAGQASSFFLNAANLNSGTLAGARLGGAYANQLQLTNALNQITGTFVGSGAGLTALVATNITSGTLPDARLSPNVARRDLANTFALNNTFSQDVFVLSQVGIGTSSPDTRLHVQASADVSPSGGGIVTIGNFPSSAYLKLDGNEIQSFTNGTPSVLQLNASGGNVVIGSTSSVTPLTVTGGTDVTGAGGGYITIGSASTSMRIDENELQVFNAGSPASLVLNAAGGGVGVGIIPVTPLTVGDGTDVSGAGGGYLTVGDATTSVRLDPNEVQALSNGAPSTLFLNNSGGVVDVGNTLDVGNELLVGNSVGVGGVSPLGSLHVLEGTPTFILRSIFESNLSGQSRTFWVEDYAPANALGGYVNYNSETNRFEIGTTEANFLLPAIRMDRGSVNVTVNGNLSKAGGSFRIDHPADPQNKYLYHSFVESPDMKNIYDGLVTTDANGYATVTLPGYFDALNSDFRYQLTVLDDEDQTDVILWAKVVRKIGRDAPNQFTIRTSRPNLEVSWQVTGIRQDAWARANRIPTEVDKPAAERGKYLHPEAHGKPRELGSDHQPERAPTEPQPRGAAPIRRPSAPKP